MLKIKKERIFVTAFFLFPVLFMNFVDVSLATTATNQLEMNHKNVLKSQAHLIISSQISAFGKSDIDKAYSFASPFIKSKFNTAENFGEMVRFGYPMIWAPKEYKFLEFNLFNDNLIQRVLFIDAQERIFMFDYELKKYDSGDWLINGVFPVQSSSSGA